MSQLSRDGDTGVSERVSECMCECSFVCAICVRVCACVRAVCLSVYEYVCEYEKVFTFASLKFQPNIHNRCQTVKLLHPRNYSE